MTEPPLVPGHPLLGSALSLARSPHLFLTEAYRRHGPIYRIDVLGRRHYVLAGLEANRFVMRNGRLFSSEGMWGDFIAEAGATTVLTGLDGAAHRRSRAVHDPSFSKKAIVGRCDEIVAMTRRHLDTLAVGQTVSVLDLMRRLIADQLGLIILGRTAGPYFDDYVTWINTLLNVTVLHRWPRAALKRPAYVRARARVDEFARWLLAEGRLRPKGSDRPETLVDHLLAAADADPEMFPTEGDLLLAISGPLVAGLDTAANECAFALYGLLAHPHALEKVRAEVGRVFAAGPLTARSLCGMTTLHAALQEALRLYPVAAAVQRTAVESFEFAGCTVPRGADLMLAMVVPHFLDELYPDPLRFDLERGEAGRSSAGVKGAFMPYGIGAHTCLGSGFAEIQITLILATLLSEGQWSITPEGFQLAPRIDPILTPGRGFSIRLDRRLGDGGTAPEPAPAAPLVFDHRVWRSVTRLALTDRPSPRRLAVQGGLIAGLPLWAGLNAACMALDRRLQPDIERTPVEAPLFVVGNARSGTTFFHRLLCEDDARFVHFKTWEILMPSAVQKRAVRGAWGLMNRVVGGVSGRLAEWEHGLLEGLRARHALSLGEPEEDEFLFLATCGTPVLNVLFPYPGPLDHLAVFDHRPEAARQAAMAYYTACVRRQLAVHGGGRSLLSKNPSFVYKMRSLAAHFPDGRFVYLVRDPRQTIPSLLKLLDWSWSQLGIDAARRSAAAAEIAEGCIRSYLHADRVLAELDPARWCVVQYADLMRDAVGAVEAVYDHFDLTLDARFADRLRTSVAAASGHRSGHSYGLEDFGLKEAELCRRLAPAAARFGWAFG